MKRPSIALLALPLALACSGSFESEDPAEDPEAPKTDTPAPAPPDPQEPVVCAELAQAFETVEPTISVVVDRSGSMNADFGAVSRWNAVYETLLAPGTGAVNRLNGFVRFGMTFFNNESLGGVGVCPNVESVAPATDNAAALDALFQSLGPAGETPTGASLQAAADLIAGEPEPRFLILATDGLPDTCEQPLEDGSPLSRSDAVAGAEYAFSLGIPTYVLSVGPDVALDHLQEMANAGAGLDPMAQSGASYHVALDPDSLVDAFDEIVGSALFCSIPYDPVEFEDDGEGYRFAGIRVMLDGTPLEENIDWRIMGDTIQILGASCDAILDGGEHEVKAQILCELGIQ